MSASLQTGQFYGTTQKRMEAAGFVLTEVRHERGRKLPAHTHESAYFGLLLDGGYTEWFTKKATEYQPFMLGFHPPGLTHEDEIGACGARMLCVEIRDSFWQKMRDYLTAPKFTPELCGEETVWLCVRVYRAFRAGTADAFRIEEACAEMVERCAHTNKIKEGSTPSWMGKAVDLLRASFGTQITLETVAKELGVHPIHLSRVFRKKYGCTLGEYVNRLRVQFVCREMSRGWPSLGELAFAAGFADQSHMGRVFRTIVGETPSRFREFMHDATQSSA